MSLYIPEFFLHSFLLYRRGSEWAFFMSQTTDGWQMTDGKSGSLLHINLSLGCYSLPRGALSEKRKSKTSFTGHVDQTIRYVITAPWWFYSTPQNRGSTRKNHLHRTCRPIHVPALWQAVMVTNRRPRPHFASLPSEQTSWVYYFSVFFIPVKNNSGSGFPSHWACHYTHL